MAIVEYEHHEVIVSVVEKYKGLHKDMCLCHQGCTNFRPMQKTNCPIAQKNYEMDVEFGILTPVLECPQYEKKF